MCKPLSSEYHAVRDLPASFLSASIADRSASWHPTTPAGTSHAECETNHDSDSRGPRPDPPNYTMFDDEHDEK